MLRCARSASRLGVLGLFAVLGLGLSGGLGGCAGVTSRPGAGRPYPEVLARVEPLDIQVFRDGTEITLTNTTARSYGPSWIWLNGWYGREIDGLAIGQKLTLALTSFRDEFDEGFRAGGFFAAERAEVVILAELETDQAGERGTERVLMPLIVVRPND